MKLRRFYVPPNELADSMALGKTESHHLARVLRVKIGENIAVFDGVGNEISYRVEAFQGDLAVIRRIGPIEPFSDESPIRVTLATVLLKKSKSELVLQKAVELGVTRFVPLLSSRCEVPAERWKPARAKKIAIEAAKQSGRAVVPDIEAVTKFS